MSTSAKKTYKKEHTCVHAKKKSPKRQSALEAESSQLGQWSHKLRQCGKSANLGNAAFFELKTCFSL
jgi:hypothetical protein